MDPFLGEIRLMSFPFAPQGWMYCQGQLLNIMQNQPLFALLGTTYGGDGRTTFALPDLRGRAIVGVGSGPGLSPYVQGQQGGTEMVTLQPTQIPQHSHTFTGTVKTGAAADLKSPSQAFPATGPIAQYSGGTPTAPLNPGTLTGTLANTGGSAPHENRQPLLVLNYAIATTGVFPSRQ
ncbi:phage tail protein [Hymenobacter koreensis]|uniref:Tail fiber protein n=1 Tax=Hymenobacter koreensis TaxID=1084523 RepID=A0ABP8JMJ1_9BACT